MGSQLADRGFLPQASQAERVASTNITELVSGIDRAADSVLGSETDAVLPPGEPLQGFDLSGLQGSDVIIQFIGVFKFLIGYCNFFCPDHNTLAKYEF